MTETVRGPRYGYAPTAAFAATRASADLRRARAAATVTNREDQPSRAEQLLRKLSTIRTVRLSS